MKTLKSKFVLPAVALVLALAASAFTATEATRAGDDAFIQGYVPTLNPMKPCDVVQVEDCKEVAAFICTIGTQTVYQFLNGTSCHNALKRDYP